MNRFKIIYGGVLIVAVLSAFGLGSIVESKKTISVMEILEESEIAYLSERFDLAYEKMPPDVAIWEGTNLLSYLEHNISLPPAGKERMATISYAHARLARLFNESNNGTCADKEAQACFQSLKGLADYVPTNSVNAVSNLLLHDGIKRSFVAK